MAREEAMCGEAAPYGGVTFNRLVVMYPCAHEKAVPVVDRTVVSVTERARSPGDVVGDDAVHKDDARPPVRHVDAAAVVLLLVVPGGRVMRRAACERQVRDDDVVRIDAETAHGVRAAPEALVVNLFRRVRTLDDRAFLRLADEREGLREVDAVRHRRRETVERATYVMDSVSNEDGLARLRRLNARLDRVVRSVELVDDPRGRRKPRAHQRNRHARTRLEKGLYAHDQPF